MDMSLGLKIIHQSFIICKQFGNSTIVTISVLFNKIFGNFYMGSIYFKTGTGPIEHKAFSFILRCYTIIISKFFYCKSDILLDLTQFLIHVYLWSQYVLSDTTFTRGCISNLDAFFVVAITHIWIYNDLQYCTKIYKFPAIITNPSREIATYSTWLLLSHSMEAYRWYN